MAGVLHALKRFQVYKSLFQSIVTLSGGLSLTRFPFHCKANFREGLLTWFEEDAMYITVHLSHNKWWFPFTKDDQSLPENLCDFWALDSMRCSGIWSAGIVGSTL